MAEQESLTHQNATHFITACSELCKVLFFGTVCDFFVCVWNISGIAERIYAKFTGKTFGPWLGWVWMSSSKVKVSGWQISSLLKRHCNALAANNAMQQQTGLLLHCHGVMECTDSERKAVTYNAACVQFMLGKTYLASSGNFNRPGRAAIQVCVCVCVCVCA